MGQMNNQEHERYGMIRLFETYISALSRLMEQDALLFTWRRNRVAVSHRLAHHLNEGLSDLFFPSQRKRIVVDMGAAVLEEARALIPDILVHDRDPSDPHRLMAIVCREGYLTEEELWALHELKVTGSCELTLAMAFLPQKDYMLIYRADGTAIDYYHYIGQEKHCHLLKRREISDVSSDARQLHLAIKESPKSAPRR
jgi:hypothetical protein